MKRRLRTRRDPGQSIVLIALILAILIGIVALSVDVGNAYAQQRAAQRATDAASLNAMRVVIDGGTRRQVLEAVSSTLHAHRIPFNPDQVGAQNPAPPARGERNVKVTLVIGDQNGSQVPVTSDDTSLPNNVRYVKVELDGTETTTFATVVGRDDLPVHARSYARRAICPPFPIGIREDAFTVTDAGDQTYSDGYYTGLHSRRLFLRDNTNLTGKNQPSPNPDTSINGGRFAWLRWRDLNNGLSYEDAMTKAITGDGTSRDFEEAPWPTTGDWTQGKPSPYPSLPFIIGETDVAFGNVLMMLGEGYTAGPGTRTAVYNPGPGFGGNAAQAVAQQLKWHVDNRTLMNLPLYKARSTGVREGGRFQIQAFGSFMIIGFGYDNAGDSFSKGWYLDVVKVGKPCETAEGIDEGNLNDRAVKLAGRVELKPRYERGASSLRDPIDLVVVLDASGSMNWNWDGFGSIQSDFLAEYLNPPPSGSEAYKGRPIECASAVILALRNGCQPADAWGTYQDRRLYIAKQAVKGFLEQFPWQPQDRAAVVTYNRGYSTEQPNIPTDPRIIMDYTTKVFPSTGLSSNIVGPTGSNSVVDQLVRQAGSTNPNEPPGSQTDQSKLYTTTGASPGALGLRRAANELDKAPNTGHRERVVIFFTDGLLNVDINGIRSTKETIEYNTGEGKPITQAIEEADAIKTDASKPAAIFVVALSTTFDDSGLREMASGRRAPFFQEADDPDALENLLSNIGNQVINGDCDPQEEEWQVPNMSNVTDQNGAASTRVGTLVVRDTSGNQVTSPLDIKAGGTWEVPGLQPNTNYTLEFTIYYRGLDNQVRRYNNVYYLGNEEFTNNSLLTLPTMPVSIADTGLSYTQSLPDPVLITMPLSTELCVSTTPPTGE